MARLQAQGKAVRYRCDSCNLFPITGFRWRCLNEACKEFDLCEDCHTIFLESKQIGSHRRSHTMERLPVSNGPPSEEDNERLFDRILVPPGVDSNDSETLMRMAVAMSLSLTPSTEPFERYLPVLRAICEDLVSRISSIPQQHALDKLPYLNFLLLCTVHFPMEELALFSIVDVVTQDMLIVGCSLEDRLLNALFLKVLLNVPHNRSAVPHILQKFPSIRTELWSVIQFIVARPFPTASSGRKTRLHSKFDA